MRKSSKFKEHNKSWQHFFISNRLIFYLTKCLQHQNSSIYSCVTEITIIHFYNKALKKCSCTMKTIKQSHPVNYLASFSVAFENTPSCTVNNTHCIASTCRYNTSRLTFIFTIFCIRSFHNIVTLNWHALLNVDS